MSSPMPITTQPETEGVARPATTSPQTLDNVRCSRCQRTLNIGPSGGAVQFGMNSYYCSRCAAKVGFGG
ncbi:uncharacterized protein N7515_002138 [Penicillium bovifimosum]|uniref:Uncharacterized protein n=1 Tax=Penicillium bovifimosum TaxID=126998 RepID=A0A9W9HB02_9EURO|nr:uncharacterized protein N7515_002138 [Penicillium bovifimosum]KAJ5143351.1 hypothetical protein N7515_002138 [Penicillium bovifimosum]